MEGEKIKYPPDYQDCPYRKNIPRISISVCLENCQAPEHQRKKYNLKLRCLVVRRDALGLINNIYKNEQPFEFSPEAA